MSRKSRRSPSPQMAPSRTASSPTSTAASAHNTNYYVHVPNVVFSCAMVRRPDGAILIYYGGNDTVMNLAVTHEDILIELCVRYGQDPLTGRRLYDI